MKTKNLFPIFLIMMGTHAFALSPEGRRSCESLVDVLKQEMKVLAAKHEEHDQLMSARQYLRQLEAALAQTSDRQISQILEEFGNYVPTDEVTKLVESINQDLKAEVKRKVQMKIDDLEGAFAAATEAVQRAEEPEDLDKIVVSLSRNRFSTDDGESYSTSHPAIRGLMSELSQVRQFVTGWQDYLQASNSGDTAKALQVLRNLSVQDNPLIPRSQLIARMDFEIQNEGKVTMILKQVKNPGEMKEAIRQILRLTEGSRAQSSENPGFQADLRTLIRLEAIYSDHLAGLPIDIQQLGMPDAFVGTTDFSSLRAQLILLVMPRALDLSEDLTVAPGETVEHFLLRAIEEARKREDYSAILRIRRARHSLSQTRDTDHHDDLALSEFIEGRNQYEAGQYSSAVVSLQNSLKDTSNLVPMKKVGELLELIRKDHPAEFEKGKAEFANSDS